MEGIAGCFKRRRPDALSFKGLFHRFDKKLSVYRMMDCAFFRFCSIIEPVIIIGSPTKETEIPEFAGMT